MRVDEKFAGISNADWEDYEIALTPCSISRL